MKSGAKPVAVNHQIVVQNVGDEIFIYELKTNKVWCLNETSSFVWKLCDGRHSVSEITAKFSHEFNIYSDDSLVWLTLDSLTKSALLENGEEVMKSVVKIFSRREAIKKAGLTSFVAMPFVSSVIAPSAAHAQSGCIPLRENCVFDDFNQSNCCDPTARCRDLGGRVFCNSCVGSNDFATSCNFVGCCTGKAEANLCCSGTVFEREFFGNPGNYFCVCN